MEQIDAFEKLELLTIVFLSSKICDQQGEGKMSLWMNEYQRL